MIKITADMMKEEISMRYVVIGAGGTGGAIGGFLAKAGKDVTLIARGKHLARMKEDGLRFETPAKNFTIPVNACTMEAYSETPDIIFVCVKGYSLEDVIPCIRRIASPHTVVIPILNIYGTGRNLQTKLPHITVTDGCIYIASQIKEPGTILMSGQIFRVVFGLRRDTPEPVCRRVLPILRKVENDLAEAAIRPLLSGHIERDALQKFSFVSPMAAVGAGYDVPAASMQTPGPMRTLFSELVMEIKRLSDAMNVSLPEDILEINLKIMDDLAPEATASMQRDIKSGHPSEVNGLIYEVIRLGRTWQVELPAYEQIAEKLHRMLD